MITSGCANSEARDGTSLPTKGMASLRRERGILGSSPQSRTYSASLRRPNETRSCGGQRSRASNDAEAEAEAEAEGDDDARDRRGTVTSLG